MNKRTSALLMMSISLIVALLTLMAAAGCATPPGNPSFSSGPEYLTQSAANLAAATAVARQTADAATAIAQQTAEVVRQTEVVREQWAFEATQTAVAVEAARQESAQATATAQAHQYATATAQVQATAAAQAALQATKVAEAHATGTAQAHQQATATAEAHAVQTAQANQQATATASVVETRTAMELAEEEAERAVRMKRLRWQEMTAPLIYVGELLFWLVLVLIALWTLVWLIPRLYHLLALKLSSKGDIFFVPMLGGREDDGGWSMLPSLIADWMDIPRLLAYNPRRDRGPGQVIDTETADPGLLPGYDPATTGRAQGVELAEVMAKGNGNGSGGGRVSKRAVERFSKVEQNPRYVVLAAADAPPQSFLHPQQMEILDAQWEEVE